MNTPSKLAVEIAEAIRRDILDRHMVNEGEGSVEDMQYAYDENEALIQLDNSIAALIDAKLAPLVEDRAGLEAKHEAQMGAVGQYEETLRKTIERTESERDSLLVQVENQASIIRDTATPANERELRMLDELYSLRALVVRLRGSFEKILDEIRAGYNHHIAAGLTFSDKGTVSSRFRTAELEAEGALQAVPADLADCVLEKRGEWERKDSLIAELIEAVRFAFNECRRIAEHRKTLDPVEHLVPFNPRVIAGQVCSQLEPLIPQETTALRTEAKGGAK